MALNFFKGSEKSPATSLGVFDEEMLSMSSPEKTTFEIQNVPLSPKNIADLATALKSNTSNIKTLKLNGTKLANSTQLIPLFEAIKKNASLQVLDMCDNPLGDDGIELLANVVKYKHNIVEVHVRETGITAQGCKALKSMLEINKKIVVLDLSENQLNDNGVKYICQGILDSPLGEKAEIEKISLADTQIGENGSKIIGSVLASSATLRDINLADNNINSSGAKYISHGLMKKHVNVAHDDGFRGLEVLNISNNPLGDAGVSHIAKRLPASGAVKVLYLENVNMKANSLGKLCQNLVDSDTVEKLSIAANPIEGDLVAKSVIELLTNTSNLGSLNLSGIELSKEDVKTLGDFLSQRIRCRLHELNLSNTNIDDEGAVHIANGIKENMDLKVLNVTSNPFGPKGAKAFAKIFRRAKSLETFCVTGQSRIKAEGENYLAECLKYNKKLKIKGASRELDYIHEFLHNKKAFKYNSNGEISAWSEEAWEVVKRGCGQIIGTVIYNMKREEFKQFKENVLTKSRNVVKQDMFEYVLRHAETPALDVVSIFVNKCKLDLDKECGSSASVSMAQEKRKSDDVTYRFVAKDHAKDPMVREMAKNNRLFLGRYLTENGPAVHETHEITRFKGKDTLASSADKDRQIFVQIYENDYDFSREHRAREEMKEQLSAGGPFAIYDTILKEVEIHEDNNVISFRENITDLRHCINNLGVTAGYNIHETVFLAKRAAQCLGTINNLGRIHGDFRPRNFLKVAKKRLGSDPVGRSSKKIMLPDKWVVFDLSKSVAHGEPVELRMDSSYIPPEVARVTFNVNYTDKQLPMANEKIDVWSFGVVLYQLLTGTHLFHTETNTDRMYKTSERLQLMNWINLSESRQRMILHRCNESRFANKTTYERIKAAAVDLVNWCLQGDPYNRPSFNDILSHPFFTYKTNVNYTDVDLLLGWYKKIGSDISTAKHKNNRTHAHVLNTCNPAAADVFKVLKYYYSKAGCTITNDSEDWKLDINKRREKVQKARTLIVLLEEDVFWRTEIMQKILWAMDSIETTNLILIDISTASTSATKFDFDSYLNELESDEGKKKMKDLLKYLTPIEEKLYLTQIPHEKTKSVSSQRTWLKNYIMDEVNEYIMSLKDKVIPYRTREFQTQAMVNEILKRSGFYDVSKLKKFSLFFNNTALYSGAEEEEEEGTKKEKGIFNILVLYNEETMQVKPDQIRKDALTLRQKLVGLENDDSKPVIKLVSDPDDVYKYFRMDTVQNMSKDGAQSTTRVLTAETMTVVLCLVSQGFYEVFREQILLLNAAKGLVAVLPISYDQFDVSQGHGKEEVLNLGLENSAVLDKLSDNKNYIPLPKASNNLKYETDAALAHIVQEAEKMIEITKKNEEKDENDVYVKYSKTNFFSSVY